MYIDTTWAFYILLHMNEEAIILDMDSPLELWSFFPKLEPRTAINLVSLFFIFWLITKSIWSQPSAILLCYDHIRIWYMTSKPRYSTSFRSRGCSEMYFEWMKAMSLLPNHERGTIILAELPNSPAIAVPSDTWRVELLFDFGLLLRLFIILLSI